MRAVGSERVALFGAEAGGTIMLLFAASYPERVTALALFAPVIYYWRTPDFPVRSDRRGREIKTMGDGFLATFEGPARAVYCARAIAEHVRPLGIEVRSGLHTGEVELDGDDIAGLGVAIGARVGAMGGPSEVLVPQTVKDLVAGSDCHSKTPACTNSQAYLTGGVSTASWVQPGEASRGSVRIRTARRLRGHRA
ncbi:MAG TPA: hypothetical protein VHM47_07980 [Actinomycetota bacterium]|nr:hypothetical protein [Actinomycetota bacterium]